MTSETQALNAHRQYIHGGGIPPKFPGQHSVDRVDVVGKKRRITGGYVIRVESTLWNGETYRYDTAVCNIYNANGTRPFGS